MQKGALESFCRIVYNTHMIQIPARLLTMRTMRGLFLGETIMGKKLKKHLSIDGQIAKLASRGLIIEDEDYARDVLDRISYYRLTGYLHDFREPGSDSL